MIKEQGLDVFGSLGLMLIWCYYSRIHLIQKLVLWITCYSPGHLWQRKWQRTFNETAVLWQSLTTSNFRPLPPALSACSWNTQYNKQLEMNLALWLHMGRESSISTVTRYRLDGPGIKFQRGARLSTRVQTGPGAHPAFNKMGTESFPGVKQLGLGGDHPPHLAPRLKKEWKCTSSLPLGLHGLFQGELYLLHWLHMIPKISCC
jgi:hypothetical protein